MRYVKGHGLQTRSRIVEQASYGLRQTGANGMSLADLMRRAGLTHGGFYSHFESREALVIEAFAWAMDRTVSQWRNFLKDIPAEKRFDAFVELYLRRGHCDDRARGCVLPALSMDIARSTQKARRAFARKLDVMIEMVAELFAGESPERARQIATGALATMLGSIALARAVGNRSRSDEILGAGRQALRANPGRRPRIESGIRRSVKICMREYDHD